MLARLKEKQFGRQKTKRKKAKRKNARPKRKNNRPGVGQTKMFNLKQKPNDIFLSDSIVE